MPGDATFWTSRGNHRPPHLYIGGVAHWITGATLNHAPFVRSPARKEHFLEVLGNLCAELRVIIIAWVLLDDHYHAIMVPEDAPLLGVLLGRLHRTTATSFNREDGTAGRQVWYSHWDTVLRTEGDMYSRINYTHRNPVKHGYVTDPAEWPWSSYRAFLEVEDPEVLDRLNRFPSPLRLPND